MAYPRDSEEYEAMNGFGILWVTVHSQVAEELPLKNTHSSTVTGGNIELEEYSWFSSIEENELASSSLGE